MLELMIYIIIIALYLAFFVYGAIFFMCGIAYGYWGLSIGMAPILWILMGIGVIIGLVGTVKNALKAAKEVKGRM